MWTSPQSPGLIAASAARSVAHLVSSSAALQDHADLLESSCAWEGKLFKQIILVSNQLVFAKSSTIDLTE